MAPCTCGCSERIDKLDQQVSVMRKEIKNLRQSLDSAVRAHRKLLNSIQSAVTRVGSSESVQLHQDRPRSPPELTLEQGNIQTVPIGFIRSCFAVKNATPRQPTICGPSRAELRIEQRVFNNPDHALVGLDQYSHVWIIFLFHKNGHLSYKAKVKPPRLNGQRVGVYSTRSPHRPNALGLTLAKLDKIIGDTIHLSGIDMIAGTPVLDIKPYIPEYDSPHARAILDVDPCQLNIEGAGQTSQSHLCNNDDSEPKEGTSDGQTGEVIPQNLSETVPQSSQSEDLLTVLEEVKDYLNQREPPLLGPKSKLQRVSEPERSAEALQSEEPLRFREEDYSTIASWIREPPVSSLEVRFTPHSQEQLAQFIPGTSGNGKSKFRFLRSSEEAVAAIRGVLSADPRSVYRRTRCKDRLFFFTLDTADVTAWFGEGFAEVLRVRPVEGDTSV
ncbi:tRNA (adenine(37)-N6)-methyltransferase isoform X1 [Synchiropus splendidus]|uniref:tRNA (adenine(37)-N6)-methyltransferase isoform X1 n=1 Tax=Synchiropus splendidus TaxID=270530 RepID=UPI00237E70A3|nr:tRNA (adenine(37)-N6)-methyltransferase isoform X1 [Synchiropus splendidus]